MNRDNLQHERRLKRFRLSARFLLVEMLRQVHKGTPDYVELLDMRGIPEGTKIVSGPIGHPGGMCWMFYVTHPSFPEVPDNDEPPELYTEYNYRVVPLAVPVPESWLSEQLVSIFSRLRLSHAGRDGDLIRWTAADLATDLAPLLAAELNRGIPTQLGIDPAKGKDEQGLTVVWTDSQGNIISMEDK